MREDLRILILEDRPSDADLVEFELQEAGFPYTAKRVMTENDYRSALREFCPDLILSDYDLPQYNGALALAEAKKECPDIPFILVTGAVGEDRAIEILTSGAKDYVMKNRLQRLGPAVQRALTEWEEIEARRAAEKALREAYRTLEIQVQERTAELQRELDNHRRTEEALQETWRNYVGLFNNRIIGIAYCRVVTNEHGEAIDFEFLAVNETFRIAIGLKEEAILGRKITEAMPGFSQSLIGELAQVALTGQDRRFEFHEPHLQRWYEVNVYSPQRGYFVSLFSEITRRKDAEKKMQESEKRYRSLVELAPQLIAVHREGKFVYINPAGAKLLGAASPEEVLGCSVFDIIARDTTELSSGRQPQSTAPGEHLSPQEMEFRRFDGQSFWGESRATAVTFGGEPATLIMIRHMITQKIPNSPDPLS